MNKTLIITGGAGFIGSHVVRLFVNKYPSYKIINLDALTYAGNLENLTDIENAANYTFVKADITNEPELRVVFEQYRPDAIIHLAAESHVDRSITNPNAFIQTNVMGTANLLNLAREFWTLNPEHTHGHFPERKELNNLFYHVSTDEVYGSLGETGFFLETTAYDPQSPYSASKAASDHLVRAYGNTYGLPFVLSNCSNNYGPNHFPEKLIPLCISNIINGKPLPIYGDGKYTRDWLFVIDHAIAIDAIFHQSKIGETYNIGGFNEWQNIDLVRELIKQMDEKLGNPSGYSEKLITYVKDRPGHDKRYAIDANKLKNDLGWMPSVTFEEGLGKTIDWYLSNEEWLNNVTSGDYQKYYQEQYSN
jgi:dTDP-glucose 4,6-dehydratase